MARELGTFQVQCLESLRNVGRYPGDWCHKNDSTTLRTLNTLVRLGYAETRTEDGATYYYAKD